MLRDKKVALKNDLIDSSDEKENKDKKKQKKTSSEVEVIWIRYMVEEDKHPLFYLNQYIDRISLADILSLRDNSVKRDELRK